MRAALSQQDLAAIHTGMAATVTPLGLEQPMVWGHSGAVIALLSGPRDLP